MMSGNTMPSPMMVDEKNVDTLATEVLHQLRESGWMASKWPPTSTGTRSVCRTGLERTWC
jgi:hypothetical protein